MRREIILLALAGGLAGCTGVLLPEGPRFALDAEAEYCAAAAVVQSRGIDPAGLQGVPIIGGAAPQSPQSGVDRVARCRDVVRALGTDGLRRVRLAQITAASSGSRTIDGDIVVTPRPAGERCVVLTTTHGPSNTDLPEQRLCRDGRGGFVPAN